MRVVLRRGGGREEGGAACGRGGSGEELSCALPASAARMDWGVHEGLALGSGRGMGAARHTCTILPAPQGILGCSPGPGCEGAGAACSARWSGPAGRKRSVAWTSMQAARHTGSSSDQGSAHKAHSNDPGTSPRPPGWLQRALLAGQGCYCPTAAPAQLLAATPRRLLSRPTSRHPALAGCWMDLPRHCIYGVHDPWLCHAASSAGDA